MATENDNSFIARLGNGFLSIIGAASVAEFGAKFQEKFQSIFARLDAVEKVQPVAYDDKAILSRLDALEKREFPTQATVEGWAKAAGSIGASEALGKVGVNPVAVAGAAPAPTATASTAENLVAEGKYAEAWKADAKLQEQFVKAEHYEKYMQAATQGRVFAKS